MSALPPDVWVPVPIRWRHVRAGDVFLSQNTSDLWAVIEGPDPLWQVQGVKVQRGARTFTSRVDPDDVVHVLIPAVERDAIELTRDELGARVIERRTTLGAT